MNNLSAAQRSRRYRSVPITETLLEILNGSLLGDGNLHSPVGFQAVFHQESKQFDFITFIADYLDKFGYLAQVYSSNRFDKRTGRKYVSHSVNSVYSVELQELYNTWYGNGKKCVPEALNLTPLTTNIWYLGDGSLSGREIRLSTDAFSVDDVNCLVDKLSKEGIESSRLKSCNRIYIKARSYTNFFNYIGTCPVACYDYKFGGYYACN